MFFWIDWHPGYVNRPSIICGILGRRTLLPGAMSCVQQEGDVVILPGGWWHDPWQHVAA